jgi:hypothetical protein
VDILSRKMWLFPLKNRTQESLVDAIQQLNKKAEVKGMAGDDEFSASKIVKYCDEHAIKLSTDVSAVDHMDKGNKLGIVDTACRTIKRSIRNYMTAHERTNYISVLQALVDNYNDTPHSSLKNRTPDKVWDDLDYQKREYERLVEYNEDLTNDIDLEIGDYVRKRVDKGKFDKETAKFSSETYIIYEMVGRKYKIMDEDGQIQPRKYKYFELKSVAPDEVEGKTGGSKLIEKEQQTHKKINRTRIALDKTYDEAIHEISRKDQPREKRLKKKVTKLDL